MLIPALLLFLLGASVGSYLYVLVRRTQQQRSVIVGRSACESCHAILKPSELIPVVSYVVLRGKCRTCNTPISPEYPLVEFCVGALFVLLFYRYEYAFSLPLLYTLNAYFLFFIRDLFAICFLTILFLYDLRFGLLPDRFTLPAIVLFFGLNLFIGYDAFTLFLAAFIVGGFFFFQFILSKGTWVGGGDVRLGLLMGALLGLKEGLIALLLAYAVGALVGLVLLMTKRASWKTPIPFGVFLCTSALVMLFAGSFISKTYLQTVGLSSINY